MHINQVEVLNKMKLVHRVKGINFVAQLHESFTKFFGLI